MRFAISHTGTATLDQLSTSPHCDALGGPAPDSHPQPLPATLGDCWARCHPPLVRKVSGHHPSPPQPSKERSVQCWAAWLPSLDLYLHTAYPQLTPPRLARAAAKRPESYCGPRVVVSATHLPHTAESCPTELSQSPGLDRGTP